MSTMKTTRDVKGVGVARFRGRMARRRSPAACSTWPTSRPKGMLHAKLLRSPHAHAKIVSIDTSAAKALPGVRAVVTAKDIPHLKKKAPTRAHAVLAIDRAVFMGQPVAAVAADELVHRRGGARSDQGRVPGAAAAVDPLKVDAARRAAGGRRRHRGRHERGARPLRGGHRQDRGSAREGGQHLPAGAAASRRPGQGLRGVRSRAREDLSRADGAPGLPRAARRPGRVGSQRAAHALGQHAGLVQHALRGRGRARHPREPDPRHPGGVRRRLRRQDPGALRADHRRAGPGHQAPGALRDDAAGGAGSGHARPAGHHQAEDRREAATAP